MKYLLLIAFLFFPSSMLQAAEIEFMMQEISSANGAYFITITGWGHDGFERDCTINVCDAAKQLLWEKKDCPDKEPIVSNLGEVALLERNDIVFYARSGQRIGQFPSENIPVKYFVDAWGDNREVIAEYAPDGLNYYVFTLDPKDDSTIFWNVDHLGKTVWMINLGKPSYQFSQIYAFPESILLNAWWYGAYLLDKTSGTIIRQYPVKPVYSAILPQNDHTFLFLYEKQVTRYDAMTGEKIGDVQSNEILDFLYSDIPEYVDFALSYIEWNDVIQLPEKSLNGLKNLNRRTLYLRNGRRISSYTIKQMIERFHIEDLYYQNAQPYTGKVVEYYRNGNVRSETSYRSGKKDGVEIFWYETGIKESEIYYHNDLVDRLYSVWDHLGNIQVQCHNKNGKAHGICTQWYDNGNRMIEGEYKEGEPEGTHTHWYYNGKKAQETIYRDGKQVKSINYPFINE